MSSRRVRHRLTMRGGLVGVFGACGLASGLVFSVLDLVRIGVLLLAALGMVVVLQFRPMPPVQLARSLPRHGLHAALTSTVTLRAKGLPAGGRGLALGEQIDERLGRSIDVPLGELTIRDSLAAASYQVTPASRGPALLGPTILSRTDVFGLTRVRMNVAPEQLVIVWPRLYPVAQRLNLAPGAGSTARQRSHRSEEDVIPREYRAGDDYRRIHWPATARQGRLMVRTDEQSLASAGMLHLALAAATDSESAEEIISAAASVGVALLDAGHLVAISVDGDDGDISQWSAADRSDMLDFLACLQLPKRDQTPASFAAIGDLLVLLASASDTVALDSLRAARTSRRRLAVIVGREARAASELLRADGVTAFAWTDVTGGAPARLAEAGAAR